MHGTFDATHTQVGTYETHPQITTESTGGLGPRATANGAHITSYNKSKSGGGPLKLYHHKSCCVTKEEDSITTKFDCWVNGPSL